ncbi:sensor histidine kinase [Paenibacillus sp. PAMC21692]|uniref:sensor histidine kinase n=1 Tax=Paenibacillus sp. PAMC21692 TaxID=2762320 RepID=UPI0037C6BFFA
MGRDLRPETWLIGFKLVLLLYVVFTTYGDGRQALDTIAILLYISFDLLAYMKRGPAWKGAAQTLATLFIAAAAYFVEPAMTLFLPIQLYGIAASMADLRSSERVQGPAYSRSRGPASQASEAAYSQMRGSARQASEAAYSQTSGPARQASGAAYTMTRLSWPDGSERYTDAPGGPPLSGTLQPTAERGVHDNTGFSQWHALLYLPALAPLPLLQGDLQASYGLIALLSLLFHLLLDRHARQSATAKAAMEALRADIHRLQRSLGESNDYIRQSEYTFKLEERNRLSQDIHDKIGHSMTGALIQMEAAKRLQAKDPERSAELLGNAIAISKEGIESIRLVLRDMKPLAEQLGLNRLRLFIDEFAATHGGLRVALTFEGDVGRIEQLHWQIIHRNVTEALTNAAKYARATTVSVHIEVLNTMVKAGVSDNGVGASKIVKGLGIAGMEERAASANGKVIVDGSAGFSVTTLLPCGKA